MLYRLSAMASCQTFPTSPFSQDMMQRPDNLARIDGFQAYTYSPTKNLNLRRLEMLGRIRVRVVREGMWYRARIKPTRYLPSQILERMFKGKARLQVINRRGKTISVSIGGNQLTKRAVREWLVDVLSTWDEIPVDWYDVDSSNTLRGNPSWNTVDTADARHTESARGFLEYLHELWTEELKKADQEVQSDRLIGRWEDQRPVELFKHLARQRRRISRRSELTARVGRVLARWTKRRTTTDGKRESEDPFRCSACRSDDVSVRRSDNVIAVECTKCNTTTLVQKADLTKGEQVWLEKHRDVQPSQ